LIRHIEELDFIVAHLTCFKMGQTDPGIFVHSQLFILKTYIAPHQDT